MIKQNLYILTGAPGSGKSTILEQLNKFGLSCFSEFARDIIAEQREINGDGLYDKNSYLFKELMLSRAIHQYKLASEAHPIIFDRGIPDIMAYTQCFALDAGAENEAAQSYRYNRKVFFLPNWQEIFTNDKDRKLTCEEAAIFGENLKTIYQNLNYELIELPKVSVEKRVKIIQDVINV